MINLALSKKLSIVEYILENKEFTQYKIKQSLGLGGSIVNQTVNFLLDKQVIEKKEKKYVLSDAISLLELVAFFKKMSDFKMTEFNTSLKKEELYKLIPKEAIFCMDSALEQYSNYYKSNKVCIYANDFIIKQLKEKLKYLPGNKTVLEIYQNGVDKSIMIKGKKYTSKIKTITDMFCDKRGNAVEQLVKKL